MKKIKNISEYPTLVHKGQQFLQLCKSNDIVEGKGYQIIFADDIDLQVAVFRINTNLYAVSNICPHRHAKEIYNGLIDGINIICPFHGWTYNLETGMNVNQKQGKRNLIKYDIFESDGNIYLQKPELIIPKWRDPIEL